MESRFSVEMLDRVRRATVIVTTANRGDGQGVLIPGGYILTAAHCVDWDHTGGMVLGDFYIQTIMAVNGEKYMVSPIAVEPCYDIAVMANVDGQAGEGLFNAWVAFEEFCESTPPVPLCIDAMPVEVPLDVMILSHCGHWISGKATQHRTPGSGSFALRPDTPIECGTSGGPIITADGRLLGVVSHSSEPLESEKHSPDIWGSAPRLTALPYWLVEELRALVEAGGD